jgi:acetyltransferase-like isoleucine patch superfamily enzyme
MLIISDKAKISKLADIEDSVRGSRIVIEDGVVIDAFVKLKAAGGSGDVIIHENTFINSGTVIYIGNGIEIGKGVLIAANCTLAPVNHEYRSKDRSILDQRFAPSKGGILIGDDVWIGANTVVCDGAVIAKGAVVGAGSVVLGKLESYGVYAGNPLQLIKYRT